MNEFEQHIQLLAERGIFSGIFRNDDSWLESVERCQSIQAKLLTKKHTT